MTVERKKALILTSTLPRWRNDTEPRFVEYLAHELGRHFEVMVLAPRCPGAARDEILEYDSRSIRVHRFRYFLAPFETLAYEGGILARLRHNPLRLLLVPLFLAAQLVSIRKLHRAHGFDAIHAHWIIPQGLVAAILKSLSSLSPPLMVTAHGGDLFALRGPITTRLKRWVLGKAAHVTVVSEAMRSPAMQLGCADDKVTVQSMGVDLRTTFTPGERTAVREGLICVGRLVEKKGVRYLIEAMSRLVDHHPGLQLVIVGDGPLRGDLEDLARRHRLAQNVRFVGSIPNSQVPAYLQQALIAVMPSVVAASGDQEGLGLVAIEAMGCGCAVVASDLAAVRDTIIDGETGLMATPADPSDLAAKIASLLDDDARRAALADHGRRHGLENFDWHNVGDRYAELIRRMV